MGEDNQEKIRLIIPKWQKATWQKKTTAVGLKQNGSHYSFATALPQKLKLEACRKLGEGGNQYKAKRSRWEQMQCLIAKTP